MIIVGGGPAGLLTGLNLLRKGFDVTVYDRWGDKAYDHATCSGIISKKAYDLYSKYVKLKVLNKLTHLTIYFDSAQVSITPSTPAYVISRKGLNMSLAQLFLSEDGKIMKRNVSHNFLSSPSVAKDRVIIGADGPCSVVAHTFNFPRFSKVFLTAQTFLRDVDQHRNEARIYLGYDGMFGWSFPHDDCFEVGIATHNNPNTMLDVLLHKTGLGKSDRHENGKRIYSLIPFGPRKVFGRTVNNKKVYLVGDAAGHAKPTTGGGLYYSGLSSELLAEYVSSSSSPEQYEAEWRERYNLNFNMMGMINMISNIIPAKMLPVIGSVLKGIKVDKFLGKWGDMESMTFLNTKNLAEFIFQWSRL